MTSRIIGIVIIAAFYETLFFIFFFRVVQRPQLARGVMQKSSHSPFQRTSVPPSHHDYKVFVFPDLDEEAEEEGPPASKRKKTVHTGISSSVNLATKEWILGCPVQITESEQIERQGYCRCKILALQVTSRNVVHIATIIFLDVTKPPTRVKNLFITKSTQFVEYTWGDLFLNFRVMHGVIPGVEDTNKHVLNTGLALTKRGVYVTDVFSDTNSNNNHQIWYIMLACLDNSSTVNINFSLADTLVKCWAEIDKIPACTAIPQQASRFDVIKYFLEEQRTAAALGEMVRVNEEIIDRVKSNWTLINKASASNGMEADGEMEFAWFLDNMDVPFLQLRTIFLDREDFLKQSKEYYKEILNRQYEKLEKTVKIIHTPAELKYRQANNNNNNNSGYVELPHGSTNAERQKYDMEFRYDLTTRKQLPYSEPLLRQPANDRCRVPNQICVLTNVSSFDGPFFYKTEELRNKYRQLRDFTIAEDYGQVHKLIPFISKELASIALGNKTIVKKQNNGSIVSYKSRRYQFHEIISPNRPIYKICIDLDIKNTNVIQDMGSVGTEEGFAKRIEMFKMVKNAVTFICSNCMKLPIENFQYCLYETIRVGGGSSSDARNKLGFHFVFKYDNYCFLNSEIVHKILLAINAYLKKDTMFFGSYNFLDHAVYKTKFHNMRLGLNFKADAKEGVLLPIFTNVLASMLPSFSLSHVSRDSEPDKYMVVDVCDIIHETKDFYKLMGRKKTTAAGLLLDYTESIQKILPFVLQSIQARWGASSLSSDWDQLTEATNDWTIQRKSADRYNIFPKTVTCVNRDHDRNALSNSFVCYVAKVVSANELDVHYFCSTCDVKGLLDSYDVDTPVG